LYSELEALDTAEFGHCGQKPTIVEAGLND